MELRELLVFARNSRATEVRFEVDQAIEVLVGGKVKRLNLPNLNAGGFDELVVARLGAMARESLRGSGRCEAAIEVEGFGQCRVRVEGQKASFVLPEAKAKGASPEGPSQHAPGAVPTFGERLRNLFGRSK